MFRLAGSTIRANMQLRIARVLLAGAAPRISAAQHVFVARAQRNPIQTRPREPGLLNKLIAIT